MFVPTIVSVWFGICVHVGAVKDSSVVRGAMKDSSVVRVRARQLVSVDAAGEVGEDPAASDGNTGTSQCEERQRWHFLRAVLEESVGIPMATSSVAEVHAGYFNGPIEPNWRQQFSGSLTGSDWTRFLDFCKEDEPAVDCRSFRAGSMLTMMLAEATADLANYAGAPAGGAAKLQMLIHSILTNLGENTDCKFQEKVLAGMVYGASAGRASDSSPCAKDDAAVLCPEEFLASVDAYTAPFVRIGFLEKVPHHVLKVFFSGVMDADRSGAISLRELSFLISWSSAATSQQPCPMMTSAPESVLGPPTPTEVFMHFANQMSQASN